MNFIIVHFNQTIDIYFGSKVYSFFVFFGSDFDVFAIQCTKFEFHERRAVCLWTHPLGFCFVQNSPHASVLKREYPPPPSLQTTHWHLQFSFLLFRFIQHVAVRRTTSVLVLISSRSSKQRKQKQMLQVSELMVFFVHKVIPSIIEAINRYGIRKWIQKW